MMKKRTKIRVAVSAIVGLLLIPSHASAQNLLTNPSFDADGVGWTPANEDIEAITGDAVHTEAQ